MCGIAGIFNLDRAGGPSISQPLLARMIEAIRHRGPDGFGYYHDDQVGFAHARLSIIDLATGEQPIHNEDKSVWITFNGEIFNYVELRADLEKRGHRFYTSSDTEVIVHLYEDHGADCVKYLNGQFAFAIWDKNKRELLLARDRVGIRPLFYTFADGALVFASEAKSLFMHPAVRREIDPQALAQIFTFWSAAPPSTAFKDVHELPAGHVMTVRNGRHEIKQYWDLDFTPDGGQRSEADYADELKERLIDSVRLQLRADVPVGAYLSGGIDSSVITALIKTQTDTPLRTFSVTFSDEVYDESDYQRQMIDHLGTDHSDIRCDSSDIGAILRDVIWHTEKPILRTAPAPLYLLSKLVREQGYKVVLTGEGSDEIMAGYDIFKEQKVRRFMEREPDSERRPMILRKLYPYLANSPTRSLTYAKAFFALDASQYRPEYYAHVPRWDMTGKTRQFFSDDLKGRLADYDQLAALDPLIAEAVSGYDELSQAQYVEIKTLLSGYLLCSQGDRVAMANSVEGRVPFLDHQVIEFCCKLPPGLRMKTLTEKYILKRSMRELLPQSITKRTKQPYMAPDSKSIFNAATADLTDALLSEDNLRRTGYFNPKSVGMLVNKCRRSPVLGFKDNMAIVGIFSTLLLHDLFIDNFAAESQSMSEGVSQHERHAAQGAD